MSWTWSELKFGDFLRPTLRRYELGPNEDANLVGMRLYGHGPFHRELNSAIQIAKKSHFIINHGDVIYNKLFAWKGSFGIVPQTLDKMFVSDKFPTYYLDRNKVNDRYLYWYFRCPIVWEQARMMSTGSAALSKLTLNPPKFLQLTMPTPPLAEQQRIVVRIEALAAEIDRVCNLRKQATEEAQSLLFAGCDKFLTDLERQYPCSPLNNLVDQSRGISYGIVQTGTPVEGGVKTLRAGDLDWFTCNTTDIKEVDPGIEIKYQRTRLRGGELLLRIRGGVGEVAVCPPSLARSNVSREIAVIPFLDHVNPYYAMFLMAAPTIQTRMSTHVKGTSYVGINLRDVRKLKIPVPATLLQVAISQQLSELQSLLLNGSILLA